MTSEVFEKTVTIAKNIMALTNELNTFCGENGRMNRDLKLIRSAIVEAQMSKKDEFFDIAILHAKVFDHTVNEYYTLAKSLINVLLQNDVNFKEAETNTKNTCPFWKEYCKEEECALWSDSAKSCGLFLIGCELDAIREVVENGCIVVDNG